MTIKRWGFYDEKYLKHVSDAARGLLEARDAYVAAWMAWNDTCLGASATPAEEAEIMQGILEGELTKIKEAE